MAPEELIQIVELAGVPFIRGRIQEQYNQMRFFHDATNRSLNLGFRGQDGPFVADFVFKGEAADTNAAKCEAFIRLFGGEQGKRSTAFVRLEPSFSETAWLVRVIQGYWAMGEPRVA